jgi:putative protease
MITPSSPLPQILAPAGNKSSFLAALAAGADAIYCGLKQLSARMEAKNFSLEELAALTDLAHTKGTRVYVTLNTLIKPDELDSAGRLVDDLNRHVHPDALIIQDLALITLARKTGFSGEIHLSTLANVSFGQALSLIRQIPGVSRVVLPRELSIDEIKQVAGVCPDNIGIEVFVHGALCYGVSGRCYWSSFFGGKSGLRGRCVQPCRRLYSQERTQNRFFSCQDLSLDVLVKVLRPVPAIRAWKIEGRKKSPHYVYYTVRAYQLLRDHVQDAHLRKEALDLLSRALGRTGTHYGFLSQRPMNPIQIDRQTGSGLCVGHVSEEGGRPCVMLKQRLIPGDVLRVGYEDEPWHVSLKISRPVSEGTLLELTSGTKTLPQSGSSVFLTDRREPELVSSISALDAQLSQVKTDLPPSRFQISVPRKSIAKSRAVDQRVYRMASGIAKTREEVGIWLSQETFQTVSATPGLCKKIWWWLTPALWPVDEPDFKSLVAKLLQNGCRQFVLNAPWQIAFFQNPGRLSLWAGPFCNLSNPLAIHEILSYGFSGAIVSPELGRRDYLSLPGQSPLPLGIVLSANWPLSISRVLSDHLKPDIGFQSPKGEMAWASLSDSNYWVYPNWILNLTAYRKELEQAGFQRFVHMTEPVPPSIRMKERPGDWNWRISLP